MSGPGAEHAGPFRRVLLASEGRPFTAAALDRAAALAGQDGEVAVLAIARVWGTGLGFPNPWLMPSRQELAAQRSRVAEAVEALRCRNVSATGRVIGTRDAARRILREARQGSAEAIVMGSDPARHPWLRGLWWSQEPQRVSARASVPVHLVEG